MPTRSISGEGAAGTFGRLILCVLALTMALTGTEGQAAVFGTDDLTAIKQDASVDIEQFDGVGRVACIDKRSPGTAFLATGWVLGSADTVVTAAHALFPHSAAGERKKTLDPRYCMFILYGADQRVRGYAHVRYALSPWADRRLRSDSSYDVAVLKLDRSMPVANMPALKVFRGARISSVNLAAFQTGVAETHRVWVTQGALRAFPVEQLRNDPAGMRITVASRMFSTSAASSPGSSGGMYYDGRSHAAIGLHIGSVCDMHRGKAAYDPAICFNYGLRFDAAIMALIDAVVRDVPAPQHLVHADGGDDRIAGDPATSLEANRPQPQRYTGQDRLALCQPCAPSPNGTSSSSR